MDHAIIIGGGIAGLSAAAALAPEMDVTLLEAEHALGYHTSGRSAALFVISYGNEAVCALNRASLGPLQDMGALAPRGLFILGARDDGTAFRDTLADLGAGEIAVAQACAAVPILNPDHVTRVGYLEAVLDIDTDLVMQGLARTARTAGARIETGSAVRRIARDGGRWRVETGVGTVEGSILINAAGAWADGVALLAGVRPVGLIPYRRSVARMPAPGGHDVRGWPVLLGPHEAFLGKPDAGRWLVSPLEEHPMDPHDAFADDMVIAEGIARYQPYVTEEVTRVEHTWAGLRTFAPDRSLVIGAAPDAPGFFWMAGQGGYGFQTAPAAGALLAALVTGRPQALPAHRVAALSPARFPARN